MTDKEVYVDFMKEIVAYDANVAFVVDMFLDGDLAKAQANIRRHPGLSHKQPPAPQVLLASSGKGNKKPSSVGKSTGTKKQHTKLATTHSNASDPAATVALDSGATRHIVNDEKLAIAGSVKDAPSTLIKSISEEVLCAKWVASVAVRTNRNRTLILNNVLIVPDARRNLISEPLLQLSGYRIDRKDKTVMLTNPDGEKIASAKIDPAVDLVSNIGMIIPGNEVMIESANSVQEPITANEARRRYGHINEAAFRKAAQQSDPPIDISPDHMDDCMPCLLTEQTRHRQSRCPEARATRPLMRIHMDMCGSFPDAADDGSRYLSVIKDACPKFYDL